MLDVLQNFEDIQDLNYRQFISFCKGFANGYNEKPLGTFSQNGGIKRKLFPF